MKSFGPILLLIATWTNVVFGKSNLYTGWTPKLDNEPYETLTAQVGDTITFIWPTEQIQNIFIHPTNDCTQTGRIAVGNQSPTEYTFKEEDGAPGGKSIFFANDVSDMCENYGMRLIVNVFPSDDAGGGIPDVNLTPVVTSSPTQSPVAPTLPPVAPTAAPTFPPTLAPTFPPTFAPTPVPTFPPVAPTLQPVDPTAFPTFLPTSWPTRIPTPGPTFPPTMEPTGAPVFDPTLPPTEDSNNGLERRALRGLQMTLSGLDSFSDASKEAWVAETEAHCTSFYENDYEGSSFRTSIAVTNSFITSDTKRSIRGRNLQTSSVIVTYNQVVSFSGTGDAEISDEYLAKGPFENAEDVDSFVGTLQSYAVLKLVTDVSPVTFANDLVPTTAPVVEPTAAPIGTIEPQPAEKDAEKPILSLAAIIGIACGGGALLIIAVLFWIYCRGGKDKELAESSPPPNVSIKPDEVSTLAGPEVDRSIGTVDYDYSKAYNDKDHSISYAGGTLGSDTQDFSFPANAGATGAALGPYDDGFDEGFRKGKFKEEILHIFAPPGKLGVVIDTPDDGAPVVHAVKETSVVVNKVKVGDKLVAVDDEDVRTLTAIKVSKLISRKSANPSRKLTVLRRTQIG